MRQWWLYQYNHQFVYQFRIPNVNSSCRNINRSLNYTEGVFGLLNNTKKKLTWVLTVYLCPVGGQGFGGLFGLILFSTDTSFDCLNIFLKSYLLQLAVVKMDILHLCQAIKLVSDVPWSSSKSDTRQRVNSPGCCWALAGSKSESKPINQTGDDSGICWQQLHVVTLSTSNLIININAIQAYGGWSTAAVGSNKLGL